MVSAFVRGFPDIVWGCYRGYRWLWHVLAGALTAALVLSGFDWWFYGVAHTAILAPVIWVAGLGGFVVPVAAPLLLWWSGRRRAGIAMGQAEAAALLITGFYRKRKIIQFPFLKELNF